MQIGSSKVTLTRMACPEVLSCWTWWYCLDARQRCSFTNFDTCMVEHQWLLLSSGNDRMHLILVTWLICAGATAQRGRRRKGRSQAQPSELEEGRERQAKRASLGDKQEEVAADEHATIEQAAPAVEKTGKRRKLAKMQA